MISGLKTTLLLLFSLLGHLASAQLTKQFGGSTVKIEAFQGQLQNFLRFTATVPLNQYFAVGFGSSMKNGNEIMFSANPTQGSVTNTQSFHKGPPIVTADQSVLYNV